MEQHKHLVVNNAGPVILVDGSYFIIHRLFATLKWYKFKNPDLDEMACMEKEEFMASVIKHTRDSITKIKKKWAAAASGKKRLAKADWENVPMWFALDSPIGEVWRSAITTEYKGVREGLRTEFDPRCFAALHELLGQEVTLLRGRALEADDVVAITHRQLREQGYTGLIVCITNDSDYLQLIDDNTRLFNLADQDIGTRSCGCPQKDLLFKVLLGDKSDNIPAISSRIKPKKVKELAELGIEEIVEALGLTEEESGRMEHNRELVDFSRIPRELVDECLAGYTIVVNKN